MATAAPPKSNVLTFDRAVATKLGRYVHQRPSPPHSVDEVAPNRFEPAPEVEQWMRSVFLDPYAALYNPDHAHLEFAMLGVLWTNKSYRKQQRWILGQAEDPKGNTGGAWKKGQREQQLTEWFGSVPDFVITLYAPRLKAFDDRSFCAILEHELYHCAQDTTDTGAPRFSTITGRPLYAIRGHDVEEFFGVAARYGLPADLKALVELANQQPKVPDRIIEGACGTCLARAA
jgi:hypothetical protein